MRRRSTYEKYGKIPLEALTENRMQFMLDCLKLRLEGKDYNEIAEELDSDYTSCRKAVKEALAHSVSELAEEVRQIEVQRLDKIIAVHWPHREEPRHAEIILKVMDRRAKYLGLDVPNQDMNELAGSLREFVEKAALASGFKAEAKNDGE